MIGYIQNLHPVLQALLATSFTWGVTALGAAIVFMSKNVSRKMLDGMLGFAAGVMIAASYLKYDIIDGNGGKVKKKTSIPTHS